LFPHPEAHHIWPDVCGNALSYFNAKHWEPIEQSDIPVNIVKRKAYAKPPPLAAMQVVEMHMLIITILFEVF